MPTTNDAITATRRRDGNQRWGSCTQIATQKRGSNHRNREEMRQSTDDGRKPTTLDAAEERGIRQPAIPSTATATATATMMATATETDNKHWVAGGVTSGGGGNGILLWI